jgi:hypothetical protein
MTPASSELVTSNHVLNEGNKDQRKWIPFSHYGVFNAEALERALMRHVDQKHWFKRFFTRAHGGLKFQNPHGDGDLHLETHSVETSPEGATIWTGTCRDSKSLYTEAQFVVFERFVHGHINCGGRDTFSLRGTLKKTKIRHVHNKLVPEGVRPSPESTEQLKTLQMDPKKGAVQRKLLGNDDEEEAKNKQWYPMSADRDIAGEKEETFRVMLVFNVKQCTGFHLATALSFKKKLEKSYCDLMGFCNTEIVHTCHEFYANQKKEGKAGHGADVQLNALIFNRQIRAERQRLEADIVTGAMFLSDAGGMAPDLLTGSDKAYLVMDPSIAGGEKSAFCFVLFFFFSLLFCF